MDGRIFGLDIQLGFDVIMQGIAVFIMFALLSYILFEPVRKILEDRKNRIADEIDQAAADQAEAAKLKAEYDHKLKNVEKEADALMAQARKKVLLIDGDPQGSLTISLVLKCLLMIVTAPVILVLTLFVWLCTGLIYISGLVLGLLSTVIALLGVAVLITYSPQNGVILLVMAFLISPMGLPLAAIWLLGKVQSLKFAIQDWVYG